MDFVTNTKEMGLVHQNLLKLSFLVILFGLGSCSDPVIYEENQSVPDNIWKQSNPISFSVDITDTLQACNFYFNVRHTEEYAFSNLFVFMKTEFPNGKAAKDTMEFILQQADGKWAGSGLSQLRDNQILFKRNLRFPLKGTYKFSFEQAMRTDSLAHISDIGLRIERFENK